MILKNLIIISFIIANIVSNVGLNIYPKTQSDTELDSYLNENNISKNDDNFFDAWKGKYIYVATFPHATEPDFNYFIGYNLEIYEENEELLVKITIDGWFQQTKILAKAVGDCNKIDILFLETLPGDISYGYGEEYNVNSKLLTLKKGKDNILTQWHEMRKEHPLFSEITDDILGIYFEKTE